METCVCAEIAVQDLQPGDVYHTAEPGDHIIQAMIEDGSASGTNLFQHNETLFFTVKTVEFDGHDTWTIINENDEGASSWVTCVPKLFLVQRHTQEAIA